MRRESPMRNGTWLEVALNGPWGRSRQPGIPVRVADIVAEGVACAEEGAAIVHVHAYDEALGTPRSNLEWVRAARAAIERSGGRLASAADVRRVLAAN
ncbi:MAG: 3-keto-5-aminohexanoate cleavage protein [Pseudomonadota bacterium]